MITEFKIFENINILPKVGDYVLIKIYDRGDSRLQNFYSDNIGQIMLTTGSDGIYYDVKFENVPNDIKKFFDDDGHSYDFKTFPIGRFEYWSESKEELEIMIKSKKYNV